MRLYLVRHGQTSANVARQLDTEVKGATRTARELDLKVE